MWFLLAQVVLDCLLRQFNLSCCSLVLCSISETLDLSLVKLTGVFPLILLITELIASIRRSNLAFFSSEILCFMSEYLF